MDTKVYGSYAEFLTRKDKRLNGVSRAHAEANPHYKRDNATNAGCWDCWACTRCTDCTLCTRCTDCTTREGARHEG